MLYFPAAGTVLGLQPSTQPSLFIILFMIRALVCLCVVFFFHFFIPKYVKNRTKRLSCDPSFTSGLLGNVLATADPATSPCI